MPSDNLPSHTNPPLVGRLAPSSTGAQHLGNARTYLIAWLSIRSRGGTVLLRIEDIDSPRVKPGAAEQACDDLRWLGLDWDGMPVVQTERLAAHEAALRVLQSKELVYPCTCSRTDIENSASAPHLEHEPPVYPGTCSWRKAGDSAALAGKSFAWRFRIKDTGPEFVDGFHGLTRIDLKSAVGDFIVWKSAGVPAYQLAVVVDDAECGVTEVVRGEDLLTSTPRQLLLYEALGRRPPQFVHVPLVVGPDGRRLAKRHGDTRLASLREAGVTSEAVLGLLARSCGWLPEIRPISVTELLPFFRLETIPREPFVLLDSHLRAIGYKG
jgi:glutamyl-tRNA synthetase